MAPGNQPAATQAQYTDQYISTFDIHMPHIRNDLFRQYGDQGLGFFNFVDTWGAVSPVDQTQWSHYEEDFIHESFNSRAAVASPGAGVEIDITLATYNLDGSNNFYPRLGDDVMFANQVTGTIVNIDVSTPTAPVVTIEPHSNTDNIGAIAQDDTIIIYSNNFAENTDQPESRVSKTIKYDFSAKIMKETMTVSGTEMTNKLWFNVMSDGQKIPAYYMKGQIDADYRMMLSIDGASLFDRVTTNPTLLATGNRTMTGMVPWIRGGGNILGYTPGLFTLPLFNQMVRRLDKYFAPDEFWAMLGIDLHLEWEDLFADILDDNPILLTGRYRNKSAKDLNFTFRSIKKGERCFYFQRMKSFNHPKLYGAAGFNLSGMGIVMPMDKKKDPVNGNRVPSVQFRYKKLGNYSRRMETWFTGGAGGIKKTNTIDNMQYNMRCEMGTEFFGVRRFYLIEET